MSQQSLVFAAAPPCAAADHVEADCPTCIEAAFTAGRLSLVIDDAMPLGRALGGYGWNFAGCGGAAIDASAQVRVVHVISVHAHGEIRGYVLTTGDGALRQRGPCYIGPWPVLDAAVLARVAGAKHVALLNGAA